MNFPSAAGQYETAYEVSRRRGKTDSVVCCTCGAFIIDVDAHDRWHNRPAVHHGPFYRTDGSWSCVRDGVTVPCGECDGCRQVAAENLAAKEARTLPARNDH